MKSNDLSMQSIRKMTLHDPTHEVCPKCGPMPPKDVYSERFKEIVGQVGPVACRYWYDKPGILSKEAYECNYCETAWGEVLHPEQELMGEAQTAPNNLQESYVGSHNRVN